MKILTVAGAKGGTGKTTTAVTLAAALASMGRRVALRDLDPQASATLALGQEPTLSPWGYGLYTTQRQRSGPLPHIRLKVLM